MQRRADVPQQASHAKCISNQAVEIYGWRRRHELAHAAVGVAHGGDIVHAQERAGRTVALLRLDVKGLKSVTIYSLFVCLKDQLHRIKTMRSLFEPR